MKLTKRQLKKIIQEELSLLEIEQPPAKTKEAPLAQAQQVNLRAYTDADSKERNVISKLESALLAAAEHETLLSLPDVVRAIKLLQAALAKVSK